MSGITVGLGRPRPLGIRALGIRRTLARWISGPGAYTLTFLLLVVAFVALALQLPQGTSPDGPTRTVTERTQ